MTHPSVSTGAAIALEAGMTAALLALVFASARASGVAVDAVDAAGDRPAVDGDLWLGSPSTGASLNSAGSEGTALAFGDVSDLWIYLASPCAAAIVVGLLWRRFSVAPCNASRAAGTTR